MSRPLTRSRASGAPGSHDMEPREPSMGPARVNLFRPTASLRKIIESRAGPSVNVPNEFVHTVDQALNAFSQKILHALVLVSKHRAELLDNEMSSSRTIELENWLLYKEDCATYFGKVVAADESAKNQTDQPTSGQRPTIVPPVFSEADYSVHALEEEAKLLLTARSVRQVSLRDMLPLLLADSSIITCPSVTKQKLINRIAFAEVCADYRARGYSNTTISANSIV